MANLNVNLDGYNEFSDYELLPPGNYDVRIADSKIDAAGSGQQLILSMEIIGGDYAGVPLQDRVWIAHSNPKAAEIGLRKLKSIATAIGHQNPNYIRDSEELHGGEMNLRVAVRDYQDNDGNPRQGNEIKAYKPVGGQQQPPPPQQPPAGGNNRQAPPPQQQAKPARPWERPSQ